MKIKEELLKRFCLFSIVTLMVLAFYSEYENYNFREYTQSPEYKESLDEYHWRVGNSFAFFFAQNAVPQGEEINIVLAVGDQDIAINKLEISGNGFVVTWNWYADADIDRNTGTKLAEIPLNSIIQSTSKAEVIINPVIYDYGTRFVDTTIDISGMEAAGGGTRLLENLISQKLTLKKNTNHILKLKNNHNGEANIELLIMLFKTVRHHNGDKY